jgi:adenylosuccinate synthase
LHLGQHLILFRHMRELYVEQGIHVVEGKQRGDEGKGAVTDLLAEFYAIVARFNGGPNAGHTVKLPSGLVLKLHGIPSGIANKDTVNVIGNGVYLDAAMLPDEIDYLESKDITVTPENLMISSAAHLILPHHISLDEIRESGNERQGSTKSGIAPCAADKYMRTGLRAEEIKSNPDKLYEVILQKLYEQRHLRVEARLPNYDEEAVAQRYVEKAQRLGEFITDTTLYLNRRLDAKDNILAESAQAFKLHIDQGNYPETSSSSTNSGGVADGLGVSAMFIEKITGVTKAIESHVGSGHFATEITDPALLKRLHGDMQAEDAEKGTKTGRVRRLGYPDIPSLRRSIMVSRDSYLVIRKFDWLPRFGDDLKICVGYKRKGEIIDVALDSHYKNAEVEPIFTTMPNWNEDISEVRSFKKLPKRAKNYVKFLERETGVDIPMIGVGPGRDQVIIRD